MSVNGSSYAGSVGSSRSSASIRARVGQEQQEGQGEDLLDRRSPLENGIFGVLFTLSKDKSETRIYIRWILLKVFLDGWQLFTTVINPLKQGWSIDGNGAAWAVVSVLNFTWLGDLGYGAYLAVLYAMVALLAFNVGLCLWVAWCFKEHKFPVVWPIKVLRVFSSVFFQAFDVASLNLLQLGISCNYTGSAKPRMHFSLFPSYSCASAPHIMQAVVSALCLVLFVAIALLLNMAEVEVNPLSRRPMALGHSGAEVTAFAIKALLTMGDVFLGWRTVTACYYMVLSLALAYQTLRWSPHLVPWMNYLKSGVSVSICWCTAILMLLVFKPGVKAAEEGKWAHTMTILMLAGLAPAFGAGALMSRTFIRRLTNTALTAIANAKPEIRLEDICENLDDPRDVEVVARCCRVWKDRYTVDPEAINTAHEVIKAGVAMFPSSPYMVLLHGNFMIEVLGVSQSGSSRIEDARKLNPGLICRFIMFVRQQQATQKAAGNSANDGASMDLLGYVEYQRKQRMVVRLHREALQAMCNFWKALDASNVSFMHLSKALGKIESSVSQAQAAYRVVLESYRSNPKLVRLYGKFLQTIKNDPWHATEYFAEADRLEEVKNGDARGPLLPDGTPLGRMDETASAVMVINATGGIQMANRHTHLLFGYKRGTLEGKPLSALLAPHLARRIADKLTRLVSASGIPLAAAGVAAGLVDGTEGLENEVLVAMHYDRLAFPVMLSLRKVSGVGEDSTFIAILEPVPPTMGVANLWVAPNGTVAACDPQFVVNFGWRASETNGSNIGSFMVPDSYACDGGGDVESGTAGHRPSSEGAMDMVTRLLTHAKAASDRGSAGGPGMRCLVAHKYDSAPVPCTGTALESGSPDMPILEIRIKLDSVPGQLLVTNRKGNIVHVSPELVPILKDVARSGLAGPKFQTTPGGGSAQIGPRLAAGSPGRRNSASGTGGGAVMPSHQQGTGGLVALGTEELSGYTLLDFLPPPWKDMHAKLLRDTTVLNPPGRSLWTCRTTAGPEPTLELRSASGKPLFMRVGVTTMDVAGEVNHVVHLARSSLESALDERRLCLSLSMEGLITWISDGAPQQVFGLEPSQVIGRGLWEVVQEHVPSNDVRRPSTPGPRMLSNFVKRALASPGHSWRVTVGPPQRPNRDGGGSGVLGGCAGGGGGRQRRSSLLDIATVTRASHSTGAVMQIHVITPAGITKSDRTPQLLVDLWPLGSITGVLELDSMGRIRAALEEHLRPVGLLFGNPNQALADTMLGDWLEMPAGSSQPADLLSLGTLKKSSLKSTKKETAVKVGPVHVLPGVHTDGQPVQLDVQVVGRPGPGQTAYALLRFHIKPMLPGEPLTSTRPTLSLEPLESLKLDPSPFAAAQLPVSSQQQPTPPPQRLQQRQPSRLGIVGPARLTNTVPASPIVQGVIQVSENDLGKGLLMGGSVEEAPSLPKGVCSTPRTTGYSYIQEDGGGPTQPASPASLLLSGVGDGLPQPGVAAAGKSAALAAGRSRLISMVKSVKGDGSGSGAGAGGSGDVGEEDTTAAHLKVLAGAGVGSSQLYGKSVIHAPAMERRPTDVAIAAVAGGKRDSCVQAMERRPTDLAMAAVMGQVPGAAVTLPGTPDDIESLLGGGTKRPTASVPCTNAADLQQDSDDNKSGKGEKQFDGKKRISTWVESKGAFYQNSVAPSLQSDDDRSNCSGDLSDGDDGATAVADMVAALRAESASSLAPKKEPERGTKGGALASGPRDEPASGYPDDDAASDGGQSAMSSQSAGGGAEYKRGKRFQKLVKLMDSSQAQQVQQRFRLHALVTVVVLAVVHLVCFALIVVAVKSQSVSMQSLGHNGETLRFIHMVITDVRSLDVISKNKTLPNLYTAADAQVFIDRIARVSDIIKEHYNGMLDTHHDNSTPMVKSLFYEFYSVWNENSPNGSDIYINLTLWDFATRFYGMARNIVQGYEQWIEDGQFVSNTVPGQFLTKSGPDLFWPSRKLLDVLLEEAAANVNWISTLQLVFTAVEGAAISSLAACYLAYLLRAVAAQRHKLYATFLVIPLGLTRALSQNTALLVDEEEEEEDMEDEEERPTPTNPGEGSDSDSGTAAGKAVIKRRATLNVNEGDTLTPGVVGGGDSSGGLTRRVSRSGTGTGKDTSKQRTLSGDKFRYEAQRTMSSERPGTQADRGWCGGWPPTRLWRKMFSRRVTALPLSGSEAAAVATAGSKRKLKDDSHETAIMMTPFILWSAAVIVIYAMAVIRMEGVLEIVAIHSVANYVAGRIRRAAMFCQEVAIIEDPALLPAARAKLNAAIKMVKDAWYTIQLGSEAYKAAGPDTERYPRVKIGLSYATPKLAKMLYGTHQCHRAPENLPCVGPDNRFYQITQTGLDAMMQQYIISVQAIASNKTNVPEGLGDDHFDFVYNVGLKDLADGAVTVAETHAAFVAALFQHILTLHIILFLLLWIVFGGFLILLLNPLMKRVSKERRRIAELMSQLPLELDVEKLVARALGTIPTAATGTTGAAAGQGSPIGGFQSRGAPANPTLDGGDDLHGKGADATNKWRAIIRSASSNVNTSNRGNRVSNAGSSKRV